MIWSYLGLRQKTLGAISALSLSMMQVAVNSSAQVNHPLILYASQSVGDLLTDDCNIFLYLMRHISCACFFALLSLYLWVTNPPSLSSISALPPPNVTVSSDVESVAGQFVELTCAVTVAEEQVKPFVSWTGDSVGSSGVLQNETLVTGATSVRNLTFDPLMTSHGGLYTCRTEIYVLSELLHTTTNQSRLTVQSEHFMLCFMFLLLFHLSPQGRGDGDCK